MTTTGLRRRPQYEEVLAAAHKDLSTQHGILGVGLQNFATRAINSPLFQRVQTGVEERMQGDQRRLLEEQGFQHDVQAMAVDAGVSAHDMNWVVANIQRPTPVPVPQTPPQTEARVDYLRVAAEMDLLAQRRATQAAHQQVADQAALQMSTLAVVTPAQQLVRAHHAAAPLPPPATPPPDTVSVQARSTGMSVRELVAARTRPRGTRTRSTPYGPSSSLAVPAGGFAASQTPPPRRKSPARSAAVELPSRTRGPPPPPREPVGSSPRTPPRQPPGAFSLHPKPAPEPAPAPLRTASRRPSTRPRERPVLGCSLPTYRPRPGGTCWSWPAATPRPPVHASSCKGGSARAGHQQTPPSCGARPARSTPNPRGGPTPRSTRGVIRRPTRSTCHDTKTCTPYKTWKRSLQASP